MRLDQELVRRGLARSRNQAARLIAEGRVRVAGQVNRKPALQVDGDTLEVEREQYVSRAAYKLLGALDDSGTSIGGRVLDAGASTGGFTQVCLERGATAVYAVDVGHGQLAAEIADDPRVIVREHLNLRSLTLADVDKEPVDVIVADVSFISMRLILPQLVGVLAPTGRAILLVKPQFEVGRERLGGNGVVRDVALRESVVQDVIEDARSLGLDLEWRLTSQLPGSNGNVEFFVSLRWCS